MNWSKIGKKTLMIFGFIVIDILIIILLVFALFYFFQDEIKSEVLNFINKNQNGEIEIEEIDLTLIKYFPSFSLQLGEVRYREGKWGDDSIHDSVIGEIHNLDISLNIIDLIQGDLNVEELTLKGGRINLIVYPDSSINLINALEIESSGEDSTVSDLILSNVTITDLDIHYFNNIGNNNAILILDQWSSDFALSRDLVYCHLQFNGLLKRLYYGNDIEIEDQEVHANLDFNYNLDSLKGVLNTSRIGISNLILIADGMFGYEHDHLVELNLNLSDENVEQLYRVFSDNILEDKENLITQGSWYGSGTIIWDSFDMLPVIEFKFGFTDLNVVLTQDTTLSLYMDFDGYFHTGFTPDLSDMKLELSDMKVRLPGGKASGSLFLSNWQKPIFSVQLDANLNISGYENIFNIKEVDSLKGKLLVNSNLSGYYDTLTKKFNYSKDKGSIKFNDISFVIPDLNEKMSQLNGHLTQSANKVYVNDFSIKSSSGNISFNGEFINLQDFLLEGDDSYSGNLQISSTKLDLNDLLGPEDGLVKVIGSEVRNFSSDLKIRSQAIEDSQGQRYKIYLSSCKFELRDYPDVHRFTGEFEIENENLRFKNLQLNTDSGNLIANGQLDFSKDSFVGLNSSIYLKKLYINKFASKDPQADIIRLDFSGKVNGDFSIEYGQIDDFLNISDFKIGNSDFYYLNVTDEDTVALSGLNGLGDHIAINVSDGDRILPTLDVTGKIETRQFKVNSFTHRNLISSVQAKSGKIRLDKNLIEIFGIHGEMIIHADFSQDITAYRIEQNARGYNINHIFDSVTDNDLVDGMLDISFWLELEGDNRDELLNSIRGKILNRGKDLRIRRIDIDEIVSKFKDTQNFRLLDVGAFVFAGPAGAVVTKSVDYANLLRMNPGDSTVIGDFISEIEIDEGNAHIEDMAFSTRKNRIVFGGDIDLANLQFVDFLIAIVNKDGCIELSQKLNGPFADPQLEEFSTFGTILAPITNAYNSIIGKDCTPFYIGSIAHPN